MAEAGVPVTHVCEPGMVHGFANILALGGETLAARRRITTHIRQTLNPNP